MGLTRYREGYKLAMKFEEDCCRYWNDFIHGNGFAVLTPQKDDYGADIFVFDGNRKRATVIQCKHFISDGGRVGCDAIQEIVAARSFYTADFAVVMTNTSLTKNAKILARCNKVSIIENAKFDDNGAFLNATFTRWNGIEVGDYSLFAKRIIAEGLNKTLRKGLLYHKPAANLQSRPAAKH